MYKLPLLLFILLLLSCVDNQKKSMLSEINDNQSLDNQNDSINSIPDTPSYNNKEIIGIWEDIKMNYFITIMKHDDGYIIETQFSDNSIISQELKLKKHNKKVFYSVKDDNSQYFQIKDDGLYLYDADGNLAKKYVKFHAFEW